MMTMRMGWEWRAAATLVVLGSLATQVFAGHGKPGSVPTEYPEQVKKLIETRQSVVLVDVRPLEAYYKAHVPGARSVPRTEIGGRANEIPTSDSIVLYADTMFEARRAFDILRGLGFRNLRVLEEGFAGWTRRGFPVESGY